MYEYFGIRKPGKFSLYGCVCLWTWYNMRNKPQSLFMLQMKGCTAVEIRDIRIFVLCSRFLSFSKVADCLFMTQPSVSKYISNLENELGHPLFDRTTQSMRLTSFGQQFLPYAERILDAEQEAKLFVGTHAKQYQRFLTLGISSAIGALPSSSFILALQQCITDLHQHDPTLTVLTKSCHDTEILSAIKHDLLDVAFFPQLEQHAPKYSENGVKCVSVAESKNYLMYSPQMGEFDSIQELLAKTSLLSYLHDPISEGILGILANDFQISAVSRPHEQWPTLLIDVSENLSVGIMSDTMVEIGTKAGLRFLPMEGERFCAKIYMAFSSSTEFGTYTEILKKAIQNKLNDLGSGDTEPNEAGY